MSWWNRLRHLLKREAADVKEGLTAVGQSLDAELARKERELAASPQERIDMLLADQEDEDARLAELEARVREAAGESAAVEELHRTTGEESPAGPDA